MASALTSSIVRSRRSWAKENAGFAVVNASSKARTENEPRLFISLSLCLCVSVVKKELENELRPELNRARPSGADSWVRRRNVGRGAPATERLHRWIV